MKVGFIGAGTITHSDATRSKNDWRGRILIDITKALVKPVPVIRLAGVTRSRAASKGRISRELVARMAIAAGFVKPISNMPMACVRGTIS